MATNSAQFLAALPANIAALAVRANVHTPGDVLVTTKAKLLDPSYANCNQPNVCTGWPSTIKSNKCSEDDVRLLKQAAAKLIQQQQAVPASALLSEPHFAKWSHITFGCAGLDHCTGGGVLTRGITEICGASAVGKTQILLQLALTAQLPRELRGLGRGVVFVCTEDAFPSRRLHEMSQAFQLRYPQLNINYLSNIYIEHVIESKDLLDCITKRLAKLLREVEIGLIVVDSVAAIFRIYANFVERARDMRKLANSLLSYAHKYNCGVVCVNQVTNREGSSRQVPCLGLSWAHLARTRLRIFREPCKVRHESMLTALRKLEVVYSPDVPNNEAEFIITANGVVDLPAK